MIFGIQESIQQILILDRQETEKIKINNASTSQNFPLKRALLSFWKKGQGTGPPGHPPSCAPDRSLVWFYTLFTLCKNWGGFCKCDIF